MPADYLDRSCELGGKLYIKNLIRQTVSSEPSSANILMRIMFGFCMWGDDSTAQKITRKLIYELEDTFWLQVSKDGKLWSLNPEMLDWLGLEENNEC